MFSKSSAAEYTRQAEIEQTLNWVLGVSEKILLVVKTFRGDNSILLEPNSRAFTVIYMVIVAQKLGSVTLPP